MPPSRRIEDRIRILSRKLLQAAEDGDDFDKIVGELKFAIFTLMWQIRSGLKNYPPELDRRVQRLDSSNL